MKDGAQVPKGYKQTEVGVIPEDWEVAALGSIAPIVTGNTPPTRDPANYGDEFLFVSPADMGGTKYVSRTEKMLSRKGFSMSRPFPAGSILFVCIGSTIGKCGIASERLTSNQQINAILPSAGMSSDFLYYAVSAVAARVRALAGEQAVPIVNKRQFSETSVAFPSATVEQEAIAEALSDADAFIESLERILAKKRQIKQGAMQDLLTCKKRLPGFRGEWELTPLSDLFVFSGGFTASREQLSSEGYCYLHYGDIHTSKKSFVDVRSEYQDIPKLNAPLQRISPVSLLDDGDIVFVDASEDDEGTSKHIVVINPDSIPFIAGLHTIVGKCKTNALDHQYRRYCFQTAAIKAQFRFFAVGTKVSGISKTNIAKITLPVPKVPEQTAIAAILSDMDAEITAVEDKLTKARNLKQGMMQELLTGRTRLV